MSYAEERIKSLCDNAITNAQNIKVAVDKLATLKFGGQFDCFDIIGNLQSKPRIECKITFNSSGYSGYGYDAIIKIGTVKNNTRYSFYYTPAYSGTGYANVPDWWNIQKDFESVCKNLTFEQLQKLVTKFGKWMEVSEASKAMQEYIKEAKLAKDFK
jgi:hypothetical protein